MAGSDLGDYDVDPVEGNPFGSMASSPNDYDVAPVDHDPFSAPPDELRLASRQPQPPSGIGGDARYPVAPPLGWNPPPLSPSDRDLLVKTVYGEARGEPELGKAGVTHAILNRVRSGGYGQGIEGVVKAPAEGVNPRLGYHEFSPWNTGRATEGQPTINTLQRDRPGDYARIGRLVDKVYSGATPDPTYGATHYYGVMPRPPSWAGPLAALNREKIGNTTFVGREQGPGWHDPDAFATRAAGGRIDYQDGGVTDLGEVDPDAGAQVPDAPPPMTSKDILAQGGIGTIGPADLPPSERLQHGLETGAESMGGPRGLGTLASTVANYAPISGQVLSGADAYHYGSEGDYGQAALSGVGAVPDVGKFVAPALHAAAPTIAHSVAPIGAMFLGTGARNVDRDALAAAKAGLQAGDHPYDVWNRHVWGQDPEGNWHTEIADPTHPPDYSKWGRPGDVYKLSEVYEHPELYENYPELADMPVRFLGKEHMGDVLGGYNRDAKAFVLNADMPPGEAYPTLAHEGQHAVQDIEGWPPGTNPNVQGVHQQGSPGQKALLWLLNQKEYKSKPRAELIETAKGMAYGTSAGEVQAANTGEGRFGLPMDVRRDFHPAEMERAPRSMQWWGSPGRWRWGQDILPRAAGGSVSESEALRRRLELLMQPRHGFQAGGAPDDQSQDAFTANAQARAQQEAQAEQFRQAHPEQYPQPEAAPTEPTTWYGRWGKTLGDEVSAGVSGLDYAAGKAGEFGSKAIAGTIADPFPAFGWRTMSPETEANLAKGIYGAGSELASDPMLGGDLTMGMHGVPEAAAPRLGGAGSDVSAAAATPRAQVLDINGVKRHIDPEFPESRVGTSVPWNDDPNAPIEAEQAAHANNDAHVGMDLVKQAGPRYGKAVADMVRSGKIPFIKVAPGATDAEIHEALIGHMTDNISGLYQRISDAVKNGSRLWYEGAHGRSRDIALTHDIPHENAAGVVAAMSPQKDWDQNVTLADWVAHTAGTTAPDATMTGDMTDWVNRYALRKDPERVEVDQATGKETRYNAKTGEVMSPNSVSQQDVLRQLDEVAGKPWSQMTPEQKAFYTRAYYEAHGPPDHLMPISDADYKWQGAGGRQIEIAKGEPLHWIDDKGDRKYGYYINNPDGTHDGVNAAYSDEYKNVAGQPIPVSWGSTNEAANAIRAFHAQSMGDISEALGGGHKVRSFFNNIIAPWSRKGDVTSDTHAVAAALLRPLGAGAPEAASGMGAASPTHNETGAQGFYPFVAEAYRRAAEKAGILPREMQSITWEALRGRWTPGEKSAKTNLKKNFTSQTDITNGIWRAYQNNQMTMDQAHDAILGPNGERIRDPRWFGTFRPAGGQP